MTPAVQEDCRRRERGEGKRGETELQGCEDAAGGRKHLHGVDLVNLGAVDDGHKVAVQDGDSGGNREESGNDNCSAEHFKAITLRRRRHRVKKGMRAALLALARH